MDEVWGNAGNIQPTQSGPYLYGIVLLNEGPYGHLGVIIKIDGNFITITEANYIPGQITRRILALDNPRIRGYR